MNGAVSDHLNQALNLLRVARAEKATELANLDQAISSIEALGGGDGKAAPEPLTIQIPKSAERQVATVRKISHEKISKEKLDAKTTSGNRDKKSIIDMARDALKEALNGHPPRVELRMVEILMHIQEEKPDASRKTVETTIYGHIQKAKQKLIERGSGPGLFRLVAQKTLSVTA